MEEVAGMCVVVGVVVVVVVVVVAVVDGGGMVVVVMVDVDVVVVVLAPLPDPTEIWRTMISKTAFAAVIGTMAIFKSYLPRRQTTNDMNKRWLMIKSQNEKKMINDYVIMSMV